MSRRPATTSKAAAAPRKAASAARQGAASARSNAAKRVDEGKPSAGRKTGHAATSASAANRTPARSKAARPVASRPANATTGRSKAAATDDPLDKTRFNLPRKSPQAVARAEALLEALSERYPDAHCELDFRSPHELLVATILSAQATDVGVNKATPALFKAFPTPADYARATPEQVEPYVRSLGFFRSKAKAIHEAMRRVHEVHGGEVPHTMEELLALRGVARKTANVVLSNAFGVHEGVVVDTHVLRLADRFGLSAHAAKRDAAKVELDLMALFPRPMWGQASHLLIWHGRRACRARGALCASDPICLRFHVDRRLR